MFHHLAQLLSHFCQIPTSPSRIGQTVELSKSKSIHIASFARSPCLCSSKLMKFKFIYTHETTIYSENNQVEVIHMLSPTFPLRIHHRSRAPVRASDHQTRARSQMDKQRGLRGPINERASASSMTLKLSSIKSRYLTLLTEY